MGSITDLILARQSGYFSMKDFIEGDTYHEEAFEGGKKQKVVTESKNRKLSPQIEIYRNLRNKETYYQGELSYLSKQLWLLMMVRKFPKDRPFVKIQKGYW
ncbi:MAG: hypothetical protein CM1200mP31_1700 [Candidatus Neomarinimicrobiota bacterium]|nr:MAG: hypothetical protein CM1200mP31_1700 [Candidatus Neomarinimicrobiota bacterium]